MQQCYLLCRLNVKPLQYISEVAKSNQKKGTSHLSYYTQLHINHWSEAPGPSPSKQRRRIPIMSVWRLGKKRKIYFEVGYHIVSSGLTSSLLHRLGNDGRNFLMHTISLMSSQEGSLGTRSWQGSWYSSTIPENRVPVLLFSMKQKEKIQHTNCAQRKVLSVLKTNSG